MGIICIVIAGILKIAQKRRLDREKKMEALYDSEIGMRYRDMDMRTGQMLSAPMSMENRMEILMPLMKNRDEIYQEIHSAGVNPKDFTRFKHVKLTMHECIT